jgi:hypothetical protein
MPKGPTTSTRLLTNEIAVYLKSLIGNEIDVDALPMGDEEAVPAGAETVIFASEVIGRQRWR